MTSRFADSLAFNALWFQSVWFCTVLGREDFLPLALALLLLHLWLVHDYRVELRQLAIIGGIGIGADAALSIGGVFEFPDDCPRSPVAVLSLAGFRCSAGQESRLAGKSPAGGVPCRGDCVSAQLLGGVATRGG